jgi:lysophospholipase L1-like esterase
MTISTKSVANLFAVVLSLNTCYAALEASVPTHLMVSLGDSLTAATLADTSLIPRPGEVPIDWKDIPQRALYDNKLTLSWASGTQIDSHYELIKNHIQKNRSNVHLAMWNFSVPGARAAGIEAQVDQLITELKKGTISKVEYVTLFIGNNDACSSDSPVGTPNVKMRESIEKAFKKLALIRQQDPIKVLMIAMPRIADLGAPDIRHAEVIKGMTCELVRDVLLKYCPKLTRWNTQAEYLRAAQVVTEKVDLLRTLAQEFQARYPQNFVIHFSDALQTFPISRDLLAIDCFHPNDLGQQKVADLLWNSQPWYK